jgi:flagellar basal-body rod protein FlgG
MRETGNPLDLALEGRGFFVLQTENGQRLTRAGTFTRSAGGLLTTADGAAVLGADNRPITLPERGRVSVDEQGNLSVDGSPAATLRIVDAENLERLRKEGGTRFAAPEDLALTPARDVAVRQGAIEMSNVNPILTLVEMIDALRVYEAAQRSARSVDDTLRRAVNEVGRPA